MDQTTPPDLDQLQQVAEAIAQMQAQAESMQVAADTVWVAVAAALVFFMQAGFAMLEGGMVRSKNTINVIMKNFMDMSFGAVFFWLVGYGLMFGENPTGWFGMSLFAMTAPGSPFDYTVLLFQTMFAATAATIVSGACAERVRYAPYIVVSVVITAFIYAVYGSWVWNGGGWLAQMGFADFAGSTVVHSVGGWCALAGVIVLGPRLGRFGADGSPREINGHSLPLVALGGFILWLGWFGFNGGSTVAADASIGLICLNTHLAASAGACGAILCMAAFGMPVLMTTTVNGGLAGLVGITAGCDAMQPPFAVLTGLIAGFIVVGAMKFMDRMRWDDPVGAVAVHGVCGAWGTLAAGLFRAGDLLNPQQAGIQLIGILAAFLWTFPTAWLTFKILDVLVGLRCGSRDEQRGLDYVEHYEIGYPEFQTEMLHRGKGG